MHFLIREFCCVIHSDTIHPNLFHHKNMHKSQKLPFACVFLFCLISFHLLGRRKEREFFSVEGGGMGWGVGVDLNKVHVVLRTEKI